MKALHITEAWKGGIATYVEDLINFQTQSGEFEEVSLLYSNNRTSNIPSIKNLALYGYVSSRNPIKIAGVIWQIKKVIKESNPNIIHLHSSFPGIYGRLLKLRDKNQSLIPIVYCAHGWSFSQEVSYLKKIFYIAIEKFLCRNTSAIINLSRYDSKIANRFCIKTRYDKIILSCLEDLNGNQSLPFKVDNKNINLGFIGRFDKQKGFDFLTDQMNLCHNNVKLYAIGDYENDRANNVQGNKKFSYLGWVDNKKISSYLELMDAIVIPSRWEGFSIVALEVLRSGKALIVSDRASLPEVVIDGYNGHIFPLERPAIFRNIINNLTKQELKDMGKNSRYIFEKCFMGDRQNIEIIKLYKNLLSERWKKK